MTDTPTQGRLDSARSKRDALEDEIHKLGQLAQSGTITDAQSDRLERQRAAHSRAKADVIELEMERRGEQVTEARSRVTSTLPGDGSGSGLGTRSFGSDVHDQARRAIDAATRSAGLPAESAEMAEALVLEGDSYSRDVAARWAIATGADAYRTAFAKLVADPARGHLLWSAAEQDAYRAVNDWAVESRTFMSNTDANGGYLTLPLSLDPAIRLTSAGSINPLRQLATVRQISTDTYRGVTSAGVTGEWLNTQNAQVADASPTVANVDIAAIKGGAFLAYSYELAQDGGPAFLDEMVKLLVDGADQLQATAYTTGAGTTEPFGIVTGLIGGTSELNTTGSEAIVAADAFALQNDLGARFQANASWLMNIAVVNTFAQFETAAGALKFPEIREGQLLRKPLYELSNLDGSINAAATANNYVAIYGDVAEAFVIVDRIGTRIELIPNLVGANQRPTGTRGAFLWFRTGSKVVNASAARILDVPTTA